VDSVEHAEMVEKQLNVLIERRSRGGDVDPAEREELWKKGVLAEHARRPSLRSEAGGRGSSL